MRRILGIAALSLLLVASACSNDTPDADTADNVTPKGGPAIVIGSANFSESTILAEIYAQGLEAKGFTVETKLEIGSREVYYAALEKGDVNFFPEYTGSLLSFVTKQASTPSPDSQVTYDTLKAKLDDKLSLLAYAPAQDQDAIVVNKQTAEKYDLESLSDLKAVGKKLTMGGPPECPKRQACIKGLKEVYGVEFKEFKPLDVAGPQTVSALKSNAIQVANLFSTQSVIAANGFVVLEADQAPIAGAENVVPVVTSAIVDAQHDLAEATNAITKTLTTTKLLALNARVDNDKEDAADVAADYLDEEGLA